MVIHVTKIGIPKLKLSLKVIGPVLMTYVNRLTTNVSRHIETSQLICNANQLTVFYMMGNIGG